MPSYDYKCLECDTTKDVFVRKVSTHTPPICCGLPMRKMLTGIQGFGFARGNFSASSGGINGEESKKR